MGPQLHARLAEFGVGPGVPEPDVVFQLTAVEGDIENLLGGMDLGEDELGVMRSKLRVLAVAAAQAGELKRRGIGVLGAIAGVARVIARENSELLRRAASSWQI